MLARVVGPEDFEVDDEYERLLVSSQDRRRPARRGGIYSVPLETASEGRRQDVAPRKLFLRGRDRCSFHPHGIFLHETVGGDELYVVNHHDDADRSADSACFPDLAEQTGTSVEVFDVHEDHLRFLRRLTSPDVLTHGNDVAVDDEGRVYVTAPSSGLKAVLEFFGFGSYSKIVRYCPDTAQCGATWSVVKEVSGYVNGITFSDGRLFASTTSSDAIYEVDPRHWQLRQLPQFGAGHDNLTVVPETGQILVASHPDVRRFLQHGSHPRALSPSAVWLFDPDGTAPGIPIFRDDGTTLSGASVAACHEGDLLLGQVFGTSVLRCATSHCPRSESTEGTP